MGKMSEEDFREMSVRLRARAARLIKQLDAGAGYRPQIEQDLAKRLGDASETSRRPTRSAPVRAVPRPTITDARFCKNCGERLA